MKNDAMRRHVGPGLLETYLPTVEELPGPHEDPPTNRRHAEGLQVEAGLRILVSVLWVAGRPRWPSPAR